MDTECQRMILELDEYIAKCKNRAEKILATLEWSEEKTIKEKTKGEREDKDDPLLPPSFVCKHCIVIGDAQLSALLGKDNISNPKKFSDIQLNFSRIEKAEIYNYVIENTGKTSEPELKVFMPNNANQTENGMTFAEIVAKAKKKDKKLKRKYRTSKPTHIEEVRNLVHLQMQALEEYFNPMQESPSVSRRSPKRYRDDQRRKDSEQPVSRKSRSRSRKRNKRSKDEQRELAESTHRSTTRSSRSKHRKRSSHKRRHSSTKKSKRRSSSRSKHRHKSSKSKKRKKDKHKELEIKE